MIGDPILRNSSRITEINVTFQMCLDTQMLDLKLQLWRSKKNSLREKNGRQPGVGGVNLEIIKI